MSEDRLAVEIRDAFDQGYEANRGLEDRVVAAIPWEAPRRRPVSWPRIGGAFAGALALVLIGVLIVPSVLTRLNIPVPGSSGNAESPAYSLAAVSGNSLFVVQRQRGNVLLQSTDAGRTWAARVSFDGAYDGMQMYGQAGYVWAINLYEPPCGVAGQPSCQPPTRNLRLYRTEDGGATWTALPTPDFAANGVFFLDAEHGWIDSGSPTALVGNDVLYATSDAGQTWKLVGALPNSAPNGWTWGVGFYHVTFSNPMRGWYLGNGVLFTTADGGHSWQQLRLPSSTDTQTPSQPVFHGLDGVLAVTYRNPNGPDNATANQILFYRTTDGGATWGDPRPAPAGLAPVGDDVSVSILDLEHFWLTSQSLSGGDNVQARPAVARTSDGGLTWTVTQMPWRILQMTFRDATHGYGLDVTGDQDVNGILSTSDAGVTWQRVNVPVFS